MKTDWEQSGAPLARRDELAALNEVEASLQHIVRHSRKRDVVRRLYYGKSTRPAQINSGSKAKISPKDFLTRYPDMNRIRDEP